MQGDIRQPLNINDFSTAELEAAVRKERQDRFVPDTVAARLIGTTPATMRRWRHEGRGPRHVRIGSNIRYRVAWLEEFIAQRVVETRDSNRSLKPE
jgi:predicted DNA-binding transcriptional regulator AlpA